MTTKDKEQDPRLKKALWRYETISPYIALNPKRGGRRKLLEELASKVRVDEEGIPCSVEAETLRAWARRYRSGGFQGLMDKERFRPGVKVLDEKLCESICNLKREVPERSLERIIKVAEEIELVSPNVLRRSTVHRVLQQAGLSARSVRVPDKKDLDRFEADSPNDLWQSDMLVGPWLPDPTRPGKVKRANLFAYIDDHSRLLLYGRFSFNEGLPYLELAFRESLRRRGIPKRVYYDNGRVYRSNHMKQIVAELGIHRIIHTEAYRPEGHGKVEALNRHIRSSFIAELEATDITTLDELNEAFTAWAEQEYNRKVHETTGEEPHNRWMAGIEKIRYAEEEKLRKAFMWKATRAPDKTGVFSLGSVKYQIHSDFKGKKVEVLYDPEAMHEVEIRQKGEFVQRAKPLSVSPWRRPKASESKPKATEEPVQKSNFLGRVVAKHKRKTGTSDEPAQLAKNRLLQRKKMDAVVVDMLVEKLENGVVDTGAAHDFLSSYGPFELDLAEETISRMLDAGERRDLHVSFYLDSIRATQREGTQ